MAKGKWPGGTKAESMMSRPIDYRGAFIRSMGDSLYRAPGPAWFAIRR